MKRLTLIPVGLQAYLISPVRVLVSSPVLARLQMRYGHLKRVCPCLTRWRLAVGRRAANGHLMKKQRGIRPLEHR